MLTLPFALSRDDGNAITCFMAQVQRRVIFVTFACLLIFIGVNLLIFAVLFLTGSDLNDGSVMVHNFIICATFIAPFLAMSGLPKDLDAIEKKNKVETFLITKVMAPFTLAYAAVIAIYAIKIIILRTLPEGEIANMCAPFIMIAGYVYLFGWDHAQNSNAMQFLKKRFPLIITPPIFLLTISAGIRIHDYGVTEERYLLLLILALGSITALLLAFKPRTKPFTLYGLIAALLMVSCIGPLSMTTTSHWSQMHRLTELLRPYDLINQQGQIIKADDDIDWTEGDLIRFSNIVSYLSNDQRQSLLRKHIPTLPEDMTLYSKSVSAHLNIPYKGYDTAPYYADYEYVSYHFITDKKGLSVSGFDAVFDASIYREEDEQRFILPDAPSQAITVTMPSAVDNIITINDSDIHLTDIFQTMIEKGEDSNEQDLTVNATLKTGQNIRLIFTQLGAKVFEDKIININNLKFYLLIKN